MIQVSDSKIVAVLSDWALVEIDEIPEKTAGGIVIAHVKYDPTNGLYETGTVKLVGPGRVSDQGVFLETTVKVGERVLFRSKESDGALWVDYQGKTHVLIREPLLLALLEEA